MLWTPKPSSFRYGSSRLIKSDRETLSDNGLCELTYYSTAAFAHDDNALAQLRATAEPRNKFFGLTGVLVHWKESFFQVLEGPQAAIETVFYDYIVPSQRHTGIVGVRMGAQPERVFSDWQMAVAKPNDPRMAAIETLAEDYQSDRYLADIRTAGAVLLKSFVFNACKRGD